MMHYFTVFLLPDAGKGPEYITLVYSVNSCIGNPVFQMFAHATSKYRATVMLQCRTITPGDYHSFCDLKEFKDAGAWLDIVEIH
jgi:hypothetical protein